MWVRRFQNGMVVVSAYGTPERTATIPLGTPKCRRITAFQGGPQAKGALREVPARRDGRRRGGRTSTCTRRSRRTGDRGQ